MRPNARTALTIAGQCGRRPAAGRFVCHGGGTQGEAVIKFQSLLKRRQVPAGEFALGPLTTVLEPAELITAVTLPPPPAGARYAYLKYALRPLDFAIVGVAVRLAVDPVWGF